MEVVQRYVRMGAGQFLRDFRRAAKMKKTVAYRKAILQRESRDRKSQSSHAQDPARQVSKKAHVPWQASYTATKLEGERGPAEAVLSLRYHDAFQLE